MPNQILRSAIPVFLGAALVVAGALTAATSVEIPPSSAIAQIWGDIAQDADSFGLWLTRIDAAEEQRIGDAIAADTEGNFSGSGDARLDNYVANIGEALVGQLEAQKLRYRFHVVQIPGVANAWAVPGGHIYITTDLIEAFDSEAQLASVLAHEISHVSLRHCIGRLQYQLAASRVAGGDMGALIGIAHRLVAAGFDSGQETDADLNGVLLAARAGYSPLAAASALQILARTEAAPGASATIANEITRGVGGVLETLARDHPAAARRIDDIRLMVARNAASWNGKRFYVGVGNHKAKLSRSLAERAEEWIDFDQGT
jgi:beta-barrel assembly-enhancing protease